MEPAHYSRDIVQRCQSLLRNLRPVVQHGLPDDPKFGGTLDTTFLIALATPMIVLPVERIFKTARPGATQAGDDRQLDSSLTQELDNVFGPGREFGSAPFTVRSRWSYVPGCKPFNIAKDWTDDLLEALGKPEAFQKADSALTSRVILDLRNALAHGGIVYLDADGKQTDRPVAMLAFVSATTNRSRQLVGLNILRVSQDDFFTFLTAWAGWLAEPVIKKAVNTPNLAAP